MKRLLLILAALIGFTVSINAQTPTKGYLKYDSVFVQKDGGNATLIIKNATRNVPGYLISTVAMVLLNLKYQIILIQFPITVHQDI
jgi:hypothetical protein